MGSDYNDRGSKEHVLLKRGGDNYSRYSRNRREGEREQNLRKSLQSQVKTKIVRFLPAKLQDCEYIKGKNFSPKYYESSVA